MFVGDKIFERMLNGAAQDVQTLLGQAQIAGFMEEITVSLAKVNAELSKLANLVTANYDPKSAKFGEVINTYTGKRVFMFDPNLNSFRLEDIAWGLAHSYIQGPQAKNQVSWAQFAIVYGIILTKKVKAEYRDTELHPMLYALTADLHRAFLPAQVVDPGLVSFVTRDTESTLLQMILKDLRIDPMQAELAMFFEAARQDTMAYFEVPGSLEDDEFVENQYMSRYMTATTDSPTDNRVANMFFRELTFYHGLYAADTKRGVPSLGVLDMSQHRISYDAKINKDDMAFDKIIDMYEKKYGT